MENLVQQIDEGDVIVTFGESSRITEAFVKAAAQFNRRERSDASIPFRVVVIGGRPKQNNENTLRKLVKEHVPCTLAPLNALPYVLETATKAFVSASSMLANGSAIADSGTAVVACACKKFHVPLLVVADIMKFCHDVEVDGITKNELNSPSSFRHSLLPSLSSHQQSTKWILEGAMNEKCLLVWSCDL